MAAITISPAANLNPTDAFLPKRSGNSFVDSPLESNGADILRSVFSNSAIGLSLETGNGLYELGDFANNANGTLLRVNDNGPYIEFAGLITVTGGTHVATGTYLNLIVNGTSYYLNLLS
jgi:hypothetical protein